MSLLSRIRAMLTAAPTEALPPPAPDIEHTDDGFVFGDRRVRWSTVVRIRAYKIDRFAVDCVCLLFEFDSDPALEMTEESNGFLAFMGVMLDEFPTMPPDWYDAVLQPPFERNETLLFER
jgi:hypothetical protein